jgi:class 3 adenylate cyclase/tetratricopeptide (TPR) repeat protein
MRCEACGAENRAGKKFCVQCGTALPKACPSCGSTIQADEKFCGECGAAVDGPLVPREIKTSLAPATLPPQTNAERRQLTVMFVDLVGSTELSTRLDPEDLREVLATYHGLIAQVTNDHDGFVAQYLGDGALVYFGYPTSQEDDAERSIKAALALVAHTNALTLHGADVLIRIGIATGLVVVGDKAIGSDAAHEPRIMGETPNLAARLQAMANPRSIVIAESTRELVGGLFRYDNLGFVEMKGLSRPVAAWKVQGETGLDDRFRALRSDAIPFIGREEELDVLLRRWRQVADQGGKVVLISGEPGVGKSRLLAAARAMIARDDPQIVDYFCSQNFTNTALYPITRQIERSCGLLPGDTKDNRWRKLDAFLGALAKPETLALAADLLSIGRFDNEDLMGRFSPAQRRKATFDLLFRHVASIAARSRVLIVFEDIHWADASTLELLDLLITQIEGYPILLVATYRPEFQSSWAGQSQVSVITLARLLPAQQRRLIQAIAGPGLLSSEIVEKIAARSDGVPLFAEELTKATIEIEKEAGRTQLSKVARAATIPATLHASLMARLDRLGPVARQVAETGAVFGREFSHELLRSVWTGAPRDMDTALDQLRSAGLVFARGAGDQTTYTFKHALVQDAAYGTLLRARRYEVHARIAHILEQQYPDICEIQPELLARHLQQAQLPERAVGYLQRAGDRAAKRSAYREAIAHLRNALQLLESLPETSMREEQELQLLIALGPALMTTKSTTAPEIGRVYARARELAQNAQRSADLFPTIWGAWLIAYTSSDFVTAQRLVENLFSIGAAINEPAFNLQAHHAAWPTYCSTGALMEARRHIADGLALYDPESHGAHALQYGAHDPGVCGYVTDAATTAVLGLLDQSLLQLEKGLALAQRLDHTQTSIQAFSFAAEVHHIRRDPQQVEAFVTRVLPLLSEGGSAVAIANAMMLRAWARVISGDIENGLAIMRDGLAAWRQTGSAFRIPERLARAAETYRLADRPDEAMTLIAEALNRSDDRWLAPELHRIRGELLLGAGRHNEAEVALQNGVLLAREQNARLLQLRAANSLVICLQRRGERRQAYELLQPIYAWFTEGFDTTDLISAQALIKQLH